MSQDDIIVNEKESLETKCKVFDACRACSFKELQQIEVCQETGFRLITHCITRLRDDRDQVISENYKDRSCKEAPHDLSDLKNGELAPRRSGPHSVYLFFILMTALAYGSYRLLVQRRDKIISQVYSNLSIVKTKN